MAQHAETSHADEELAWTPAWKLREMFLARKLSPLEFANFLLGRVERYAPLGAFITVFPDHLIDQATKATDALVRGRGDLALLHGLPVSVKDSVFTKGQRTTLGSKLFEHFVPDADAVCIERVRAAGGIVFAKSNTPEFEMNRRSVNLVSNEALNPWDPHRTRTSGGSSGGAGVATAAGLGPLAVGTDGGGSIRIPSAFNGVFGLFPSPGRVPEGACIYRLPSSSIGPIARDVRDAAMLMQVMAGHDPRDKFSRNTPTCDYLGGLEAGVRGVRMGWSEDLGRVEPERRDVVEVCHRAAEVFRYLGAEYSEPSFRIEDPLDGLERDPEYSPAQLIAAFKKIDPDYQDSFMWSSKLPPEKFQQLSIYIRDRTDRPTYLEYTMSIKPAIRNRARTRMADLFSKIDLLLTPTIAMPAFVCGEGGHSPWQYIAYTYFVNSAGYCGASVPAGFVDGMPVGLQIIGRPDEEALVLRAARAFEQARPWAQHKPPLDAAAAR
jgi:Asp-tRNA(Asn)/Glu-tRNA(Gln) amidotransferase A subunit family amidase